MQALRVSRSALAVALGAVVASPLTARAQAAADSLGWVVLFPGRVAGHYTEWRTPGGVRSVFEYNDRGRGPRIETTLRLGPAGAVAAYTAVGHEYLKDTVDERFARRGDTASWRNTIEQGTKAESRRAFYIGASESPTGTVELVRAALAAGGRIPILPAGEAIVERVGERTIRADGRTLRVVQYAIGGLDFSPLPVWVEDRGDRFAVVSSWLSIVPVGWEGAVPELLAAQEAARDARYARLARELSHRPAGPVVIRHARLFVAESASVRPNVTVVVSGDRITAVAPDTAAAIPAGAQVIDAAGKMLLPGLWDMHVHVSPGDDGLLHIAAGVTTARDMGNDTSVALGLQRRFASDSLIGPHLVLAGLIDGPGPYQVPIGTVADDSATARHWVNWYADHGYEQIKVYSSVKPELVPVIIAAAHARGLRVSGHVPAFMTAEQVVRLGFDEVQHANFLLLNFMDSVKDTRSMARFTAIGEHGPDIDFSSARVRDFIALFRARGVDIDPTLGTFEGMFNAIPGQVDPSEAAIADRVPAQVRRRFLAGGLPGTPAQHERYREGYRAMMRMVKAMYDAGVPAVSGTDFGPVGFALLRELELHVKAGIPAPEVLRMATLGAARVMHHDDRSGSVAVGKAADLVLVDGDPTSDISDIRRTLLVIKDGIVFRPAELYAALGVRP